MQTTQNATTTKMNAEHAPEWGAGFAAWLEGEPRPTEGEWAQKGWDFAANWPEGV